MQRITEYLKERNIPKDSLEANSILEGYELGVERTKREVIEKAVEWMYNYFVIDHYGMSNAGFGLFEQAFKQAMEE